MPLSLLSPEGERSLFAAPGCEQTAELSARGLLVSVLRYAAYPLLLLAALGTATLAIRYELSLPLTSLGFVVGAFLYLALLERIIPYDRSWHPEPWEWRRDSLYYVLTVVCGSAARGAVTLCGLLVAPLHTALPLAAEIPAAILTYSFFAFAFHRMGHKVPWLWRVHGVHHVPDKVNVSNNNVNQFLDVLLATLVTQLPLLLLGFSKQAVFAAALFKAAQGYGVHANIEVRTGWLGYLLVTPQQHRLHHSKDLREAGHYAADLAIWDLLFRSFTWSSGRAPVSVGVADPDSFPPSNSLLASQLHPFRGSPDRTP